MFEFKTAAEIEAMDDATKVIYYREAQSALKAMADKNGKDLGLAKEEIAQMKAQVEKFDLATIKSMIEASKTQGEAIEKLMKATVAPELTKSEKGQIMKFLNDNAEQIKSLHKAKSGTIEFTTKAIIETANASNPDGIPELVGVQVARPMNVPLQGAIVDSLVGNFSTSLAAFPYTESVPKSGDAGFVLEKGTKPQVDLSIETRYATPVKVAAHECLTEESIDDIPGLQSLATNFLRAKHDLKKQDGILFGNGLAGAPTGAYTLARAFVAGGMAAKVTNPNFMDTVNAVKTDIYTTHNFQDEMHYMANVVLVNPIDFFTELVAAKDLNGLPLYPMASLFNQVTIGGCVIVPFEDMPAGEIFVCDMSKYRVSNYRPYTVRIGWINDDFIKNQFCIVGESRFHAFVKELDKAAFVKGNIEAIKTAIEKP